MLIIESVYDEINELNEITLLIRLDLMFPNEAGGPIDKNNLVKRHFEPALEKAGIIEIEKIKEKVEGSNKTKVIRKVKGACVRFHDLRHTYASLLIEQGENIKYIQTQLGHSSPVVTLSVYAHLMKETNQAAVLRLDNTIFEPSGPNPGTKTKNEPIITGWNTANPLSLFEGSMNFEPMTSTL